MKVVILAGGKGSRLGDLSRRTPKALVEIGGQPILWHILKIYGHFGFNEFVIAIGHKGRHIIDYFLDGDIANNVTVVEADRTRRETGTNGANDWAVTLVDTGENARTGVRLSRLQDFVRDGTFMLTWCDGVADIDLVDLVGFHRRHGRVATVTATHPPPRFGRITLSNDVVVDFQEKTVSKDEWINGGFFVFEPSVFDYFGKGVSSIGHHLLPALAADRQLMAYRHDAFWKCMDLSDERHSLDAMWRDGTAPWKVWTD